MEWSAAMFCEENLNPPTLRVQNRDALVRNTLLWVRNILPGVRHTLPFQLFTATPMSHEERNVLTEILANAIIIGLFLWFLVNGQATGRFDGPDGLQVWAVLVLKLIATSIVIGIILAIVMSILWRAVTGETADLTRDERDRAISGIGWKVQGLATAFGIVGAICALALGQSMITAMNLILAGCAFGDTAGNLAKLYAYRRGL